MQRADGTKCFARDCSCLKYDSYIKCGGFDGSQNGLLLQENEENMPDILEVLGDHFKQGTRGYPILSWQ